MARKNSRDRGLFEQPSGSGVWWTCYFDAFGRRHREKAGSKGLARRLYEKRKTEIREARYFPPERRKPVTFVEILEDYRRAAEKEQRGDGWGSGAVSKAARNIRGPTGSGDNPGGCGGIPRRTFARPCAGHRK